MQNSKLTCKTSLACFIGLICLAPPAWAQQPGPETKWKLAKVLFTGLQSQQPDEMTAASGLRIGQTIDLAAIRAATTKLSESGLFRKVSSRYQYRGDQLELTFTVEEAGKVACVFDNFIWFSADEIKAGIKRELPDFDGTAAASDLEIGKIKQALARLLQERQVAGEINYILSDGGAHFFSVKGPAVAVCAAEVGAAPEHLKGALQRELQQLLKQDYSRADASRYARAALLPVFQQYGYLKARLRAPLAQPGTEGPCKERAVVTFPAEPGLSYNWDKAEWSGQQVFAPPQLDALLAMKPGETANLDKIRKGFSAITQAYGGKGYLRARVDHQPVYEDAGPTVVFRVTIVEGPQYRLGQLLVEGLADSEAQRIKARWQPAPGQPYDSEYVKAFMNRLAQDGLLQRSQAVSTSIKPDHATQTADIVIKVKSARQ